MKHDFDPARLDALVHLLLDGDLPLESSGELRTILHHSPEARNRYRQTTAIHCALVRHARALRETPAFISNPSPTRVNRRHPLLFLAAAACILFALLLIPRQQHAASIATLSGSSSALWDSHAIPDGHPFEPGRMMNLLGGFAEITFTSGVQVVLQGPCRFEINGPDEMRVVHGRASVKVPQSAEGFQLDTPGGCFTDLGTEFGVAVGSCPEGAVVLTEVFDGEIQIPEQNSRRRLKSGDSLAIVRDAVGTRLIHKLDNYRVDLGDSARTLPAPRRRTPSDSNLALGKPVFAPAYYSKPHGSRFPPETLTDGRLNDSGTPGDWSFWLAPNGESGEFTVDLLDHMEIARIELQNTRNRTHGDRGLREFAILISDDNRSFREILTDELAPVGPPPPPGQDFAFESISFDPVTARYVKIIGLSHYRHPDRPTSDEDHGGGLNEIRIYAQ